MWPGSLCSEELKGGRDAFAETFGGGGGVVAGACDGWLWEVCA